MANPNPPSLSMKPGPKVGAPRAAPASQQKPVVEAERLDPAVFGVGPKKKSAEQELLENAEPIGAPKAPAPEPAPRPVAAAPAPQAAPAPAPKKEEKTLSEELIDDDLLSRLMTEYGIDPVKLHEASLDGEGLKKPLKVHFRTLTWDDYSWAMAHMQKKLSTPDEASFLQTEVQRTQMYQALTSCRCVLKIDGNWVWDIFKLRQLILDANPAWDGESHLGVPDFIVSTIAVKVFDLFRKKLHHDLLFALDDAVRSQGSGEPETEDNPTQAA